MPLQPHPDCPGQPRRPAAPRPRTLVEAAADAILAAAMRGEIRTGARLVEASIARTLGISRVPVREALRLLESQGLVTSAPYRGMRLMALSNAGVAERLRIGLALQCLAAEDALAHAPDADRFAPLRDAAAQHAAAAAAGDRFACIVAEGAFHASLCVAAGNASLVILWQGLARQLAVIWGVVAAARDPALTIARQHALIDALERRDAAGARAILAVQFDAAGQLDVALPDDPSPAQPVRGIVDATSGWARLEPA